MNQYVRIQYKYRLIMTRSKIEEHIGRDPTFVNIVTIFPIFMEHHGSMSGPKPQFTIDFTNNCKIGPGHFILNRSFLLSCFFIYFKERSEERRVGKSVDIGGRRMIKKTKTK